MDRYNWASLRANDDDDVLEIPLTDSNYCHQGFTIGVYGYQAAISADDDWDDDFDWGDDDFVTGACCKTSARNATHLMLTHCCVNR